jgi:hypothetical protein
VFYIKLGWVCKGWTRIFIQRKTLLPAGGGVFQRKQPHLEQDFSMTYKSASFRVHMNSISQEFGHLHTQEIPSSVKHIFCRHCFLAASALPGLAI